MSRASDLDNLEGKDGQLDRQIHTRGHFHEGQCAGRRLLCGHK